MNARDLLHRVIKITGNSGSDPSVMILQLESYKLPCIVLQIVFIYVSVKSGLYKIKYRDR